MAIRDDPRLQNPLTLGGVMGQFAVAPEAYDSVLTAARKAGVDGIGSDGCDEETRTADRLCQGQGASGADAMARKSAAETIKNLDAQAAQ